MSLKESIYSVLIVSGTDTFHSVLTSILPKSTYDPIHTVSSVNAAKRCLSEKSYDFIFINSPLPDDTGIPFAIDTCVAKETVVLLFIKNEIYDSIFDIVAPHGVFTLPKPISKATISLVLNWMISARERLRNLQEKNSSMESKMEELRLVNRAKCLLISELKMSEHEAHHYISKQAMNSCVTKKCIAQDIIKKYS